VRETEKVVLNIGIKKMEKMKTQLIFKISKTEVIVEAQAGKHEPSEIGRLVNFRYPDTMLDCIKVFYQHHRDWLLDGGEDPVKPICSCGEKNINSPKPSFSPVQGSPKQRKKYLNWNGIAKGRAGTIYEEVLNAFLEEYKEGGEPTPEMSYRLIRGMYGKHLGGKSLSVYASMYKIYIRENKLAEFAVKPSAKEPKTNNLYIPEPTVKHPSKEPKPKTKGISMEKVVEIWGLLPDEFKYKQVKALVPVHIAQSAPRIDTANFIIKQFLENSEFECEEISPGIFKKNFEEAKEKQ